MAIELLVVDGMSKDKTLSIVKAALRNSTIENRVFQENSGLGTARQIVVDNARGKYIVWVDGDMVLSENYVSGQVEFMEANPRVGIAGGKYEVHLGQGLAADLENVVYVVDSIYGEKGASKFGYLPGTEGAIYRVEAIRQIDGFDTRMKGAAEDTEVAYRMKAGGWKLHVTKERFAESTRQSWTSLWTQYEWYGRGGHFIFHKDPNMITLWKMTPLVGFLAGLLRVPGAYRLTGQKWILFLPLHYTFKRIAWSLGFFKGHLDGYGHFAKGQSMSYKSEE
jgi:cellulose synthase/poly-beta-1,6-N-acetylglucosamine synthase-like glycosyltransferase